MVTKKAMSANEKSCVSTKKKRLKLEVNKQCFLNAVNMIITKDDKTDRLHRYNPIRRSKIRVLCSYDSTIFNRKRSHIEVPITKTQLILSQLRKCISEHNWSAAARCINYMLDMNGKLLPIIWKAAIIIVFNHPEITFKNLNDFLQLCLGLRSREDKIQFLEKLLILPKDLSVYAKKRKKCNENEGIKEETEMEDEWNEYN